LSSIEQESLHEPGRSRYIQRQLTGIFNGGNETPDSPLLSDQQQVSTLLCENAAILFRASHDSYEFSSRVAAPYVIS